MDNSELFHHLRGGQAQFTSPEGQACFVIGSLEQTEEGVVVTAQPSESWARENEASPWEPSTRSTALLTNVVVDGDRVTAEHEYGAFFSRETAQVKLILMGQPGSWALPAGELLSIDELLAKHGVLNPVSTHRRWSSKVRVSNVITPEGNRLRVVPVVYTSPCGNIMDAGIGTLTLPDGVVCAIGTLKLHDNGMAFGSYAVSGWGKTVKEAIDGALSDSALESALRVFGKIELETVFRAGELIVERLVGNGKKFDLFRSVYISRLRDLELDSLEFTSAAIGEDPARSEEITLRGRYAQGGKAPVDFVAVGMALCGFGDDDVFVNLVNKIVMDRA